jgi:hypothetical protein
LCVGTNIRIGRNDAMMDVGGTTIRLRSKDWRFCNEVCWSFFLGHFPPAKPYDKTTVVKYGTKTTVTVDSPVGITYAYIYDNGHTDEVWFVRIDDSWVRGIAGGRFLPLDVSAILSTSSIEGLTFKLRHRSCDM